jgi:arabinofuranosyltransferase
LQPFDNDLVLSAAAVYPSFLVGDLCQRFFGGLKETTLHLLVAASIVWLLCSPRVRGFLMPYRNPVRAVILVLASVLAVTWAWSLLWASDDAYISFRYAENLVNGHGLVFNPGERVEGYTDFLWTLIAALAIYLKADPGQVTILINLASFVGLIYLVERLGTRLKASPTLIGVATLFVAANYTLASFSTACIETMFAAMLMTWALERVDAGRPLLGGFAGIAATLTHPDHGIFYAALAFVLFVDAQRRRQLVRYLIPFFVLFVPYFIWRWHYYGDWMPNTFYAKSADKTYFKQGIEYLLITVIGSGLWLTLPLVALGGFFTRRSLIGRYSLLVLPIYLGYVAKVGGDFMLGRFFVPALPLWFLLADAGYRVLISKNHWRWAIALLIPASVVALPVGIIQPGEIYHGVADERTYVPVHNFATMETGAFGYIFGRRLFDQLTARHVTPKIALFSIGMAGYYSKLPVFDLRGLTSRSVAHQPIEKRGRPGHEKVASPAFVVESGAQLSEMAVFPQSYARLSTVNVAGSALTMVRYDAALALQLPAGNGLLPYPSYIDSRLPVFANESEHDLACDLFHMWAYYFATNPDEARKDRVIRAVNQANPSWGGAGQLLLDDRDPALFGWHKVRNFSFEAGEVPWKAEGGARQWLEPGLRPDQEVPLGQRGGFVNSYLHLEANASTGRMTSPSFVIEGDVITLIIGGGKMPDLENIELQIDGQAVHRATGCDSDWMSRRVWGTSQFRGRTATLVITDNSLGNWGHTLVDDIVEWKAPATPLPVQ